MYASSSGTSICAWKRARFVPCFFSTPSKLREVSIGKQESSFQFRQATALVIRRKAGASPSGLGRGSSYWSLNICGSPRVCLSRLNWSSQRRVSFWLNKLALVTTLSISLAYFSSLGFAHVLVVGCTSMRGLAATPSTALRAISDRYPWWL